MPSLKSLAETTYAALQNLHEEGERAISTRDEEIETLSKALVKWQPAQCCGPACDRLVPNAHHGALFAALGIKAEVPADTAAAIKEGFCSTRCRERWEHLNGSESNVLPFVKEAR